MILVISFAPKADTGNFQTRIREFLSRNREFLPTIILHSFIAWRRSRCHVRFAPKADKAAEALYVRLCQSGHMQCSKLHRYSITSSARASNVGGISSLSILAV
jgi:hypothetical protein